MSSGSSLEKSIRSIPNFPKPGIIFRDVTTLIQNKSAFKKSIDLLAKKYKGKKIDKSEVHWFKNNPKLDLLIEALNNIPNSKKNIYFCIFLKFK